jgi:hypothetical protein
MRKKKNGGDKPNQAIIHRIYVYTQKCHKEMPYVAILNKQKWHFIVFFFLIQNQRTGGQNRSCLGAGCLYQREGRGCGEMVKKGEYGANTVYTSM